MNSDIALEDGLVGEEEEKKVRWEEQKRRLTYDGWRYNRCTDNP